MDILNLKEDDTLKMSLRDLNGAINYSLNTYVLRRVDLPWRKKEDEPAVRWDHNFRSKVGKRGRDVRR